MKIKDLFSFIKHKNKYYRKYYKAKNESNNPKLLSKLLNDGIAVIENFMPPEFCHSIANQSSKILLELRKGLIDDSYKFYRFTEYGIYRLLNFDTICSKSQKFFNDRVINNLATSYVGKGARSYQRMIELKCDLEKNSISETNHFDDWRHRFKAFLYLTDVEIENGPFAFYPKSHTGKHWKMQRLLKEYNYFKYHKNGDFGYFNNKETQEFEKNTGFAKVRYPGRAGTLILVDTKGVHSGTNLISGQRILLASYFDVR